MMDYLESHSLSEKLRDLASMLGESPAFRAAKDTHDHGHGHRGHAHPGHICSHVSGNGIGYSWTVDTYSFSAQVKPLKGKQRVVQSTPRLCCARCFAKNPKSLIRENGNLVRILPDFGSGGCNYRAEDCVMWSYPVAVDGSLQKCYCPAGHGLNKNKSAKNDKDRCGPSEGALRGVYDSIHKLFLARFLEHDLPIFASELAHDLEQNFLVHYVHHIIVNKGTVPLRVEDAAGHKSQKEEEEEEDVPGHEIAYRLRRLPIAACKVVLRQKYIDIVESELKE